MDAMLPQFSDDQEDSVRLLLRTVRLGIWLMPWSMVLAFALLFLCVEAITGLSGIPVAVRFVVDAADPIAILQFKMVVVVHLIDALWYLVNRDQIDISVHYASTSIFSHISELLLFWLSLWSTLVATILLVTRMTIPLKIQMARMVNPQTRHVAGLSPQLE